MPSTRKDLQIRVLDLLGVTQVGQDPSPEDIAKVDSFVDKTVAMLKDERVAAVDPSNVSDGVFEQFAIVVASAAAPTFGQPRDKETIAGEKEALLIAQAAEGGAFSRRRREFSGEATRPLQAGQGFVGTAARQLNASPGFAGDGKATLDRGSSFAGAVARPLSAAPGFAGDAARLVQPSNTFAGQTPRPLQPSR